jgi:nucleotide-binding universal stress UspA family protein
MSFIVVGLDGSEGSARALEFALDEARLRGAALHAVTAWETPVPAYAGLSMPYMVDSSEFETSARESLEHTIGRSSAELSDVEVETIVRQGHPAEILADEASDADLLVVGSRGFGGFHGLLVGSVSQQCAQHAPCPVVIVPNPD